MVSSRHLSSLVEDGTWLANNPTTDHVCGFWRQLDVGSDFSNSSSPQCVILKQLILLVNPILFFASCNVTSLEYSTFTKSNPPPKEFLSKTQSYSPKWVLAVTANAAPGRRVPVIASAHHAVYVPTSPFPLLLRATCSHEQASDLARVPLLLFQLTQSVLKSIMQNWLSRNSISLTESSTE